LASIKIKDAASCAFLGFLAQVGRDAASDQFDGAQVLCLWHLESPICLLRLELLQKSFCQANDFARLLIQREMSCVEDNFSFFCRRRREESLIYFYPCLM
jgi:hypothetical protein